MTYIIENPSPVNGNGGIVKGRGLRHRKMTRSEAVQLAADIASGRPFVPSLHHLADIFSVPVGSLSKAVKARAAAQKEATESEAVAAEPEVVITELSIEKVSPELSALTQAWYVASAEERESFLREEIVRRVIR